MKQNIGTIDRVFRVIIGLCLIGYGVVNHSWIGALGAVPLLTALVGFCPVYCPFGFSTRGKCASSGGCCGGRNCGK